MKIESKRFGCLEVKEDRIIRLKGGLLGFSELENFVLLDDAGDPSLPFKWLVSTDQPEYGFLVTDPGIFFKDYVFDLPQEEAKGLGVQAEGDIQVLVLLTVPSDPKMITANLKGPIVINTRTLAAKQLVLGNSDFVTKHYIFLQAASSEEEVKARTEAAANSPLAGKVPATDAGMEVEGNQ
ncbi:MAG: flagellar assembly protein FliW [Bradymonadales bacterium]|nr:MAG: flagellar assembly protein FliW [Bradymonadales bacterium]